MNQKEIYGAVMNYAVSQMWELTADIVLSEIILQNCTQLNLFCFYQSKKFSPI